MKQAGCRIDSLPISRFRFFLVLALLLFLSWQPACSSTTWGPQAPRENVSMEYSSQEVVHEAD